MLIMNCAHGEKGSFRKIVDERLQILNLSRVLSSCIIENNINQLSVDLCAIYM